MNNYVRINKKINSFDKIIEIDGDKSISIRCVLLASQAIGKSKIYNLLKSEDVISTLKSIKQLGINYKNKKNFLEIYGSGLDGYKTEKKVKIDAGNSGTLARLILGLLVNSKNTIKITGDKSLSMRDFSRITEPLKNFGAELLSKKNSLPVEIRGSQFLRPISYDEKIGSAQCKSAVMLAALKTPGLTKIKAKKSRNHSETLFKSLNIPIKIKKGRYFDIIEINGQKNFQGFDYIIPGDISSSSFFLVLTILAKNSKLIIKNVNINSTRTGILNILNKMNANIKIKNKKIYKGEPIGDLFVKSSNNLKAIKCPKSVNSSAIDEFLVIFLIAAKAKGVSSFEDLGELNKKESPRLNISLDFLNKIGVKYKRKNDDIKIYGDPNLEITKSFKIKNYLKDHRVFMMSCIAALTLVKNCSVTIYDKDSIKTSFPNFLNILKKLGAKIN